MNSIIDQGKNITSALNELEKFFIEVNSLQILLKDKLDKFLDTSIKFKAYNQEESFCFSDSNWLFPWYNISIAIFGKRKTNLEDCNANRIINFQLSFSGESVAIPNQVNRPLIHVSSSSIRYNEEWFIKYPIDRKLYFDEFPGSFSLEDNAVIWSIYEDGSKFWHYSIDLLKINSQNFQELLIDPVYHLLHGEPWLVAPNSALDYALVRYENLESIMK